jgi:hypothetical protein
MSPKAEERLRTTARHARNATVEVAQCDRPRARGAGTAGAAATDRRTQGDEAQQRGSARVRLRRGGLSSANRTTARRLDSFDYLLLALIAIGVAITIAMAIVDPAG